MTEKFDGNGEKDAKIRSFFAALSTRPQTQTKGEERNRKRSGLHSVHATANRLTSFFSMLFHLLACNASLPVNERSQFSNVNSRLRELICQFRDVTRIDRSKEKEEQRFTSCVFVQTTSFHPLQKEEISLTHFYQIETEFQLCSKCSEKKIQRHVVNTPRLINFIHTELSQMFPTLVAAIFPRSILKRFRPMNRIGDAESFRIRHSRTSMLFFREIVFHRFQKFVL